MTIKQAAYYRTTAHFLVADVWVWVTWSHQESDIDRAIEAKAGQLYAKEWTKEGAIHVVSDRAAI